MSGKLKEKEIIVFTMGDANSVDTWSNVPYFFTTTLEKKGYIVHRVDISIQGFIMKLIGKIFNKLYNMFFTSENKKVIYDFTRTCLFYNMVNKTMKNAVKEHPNASLLMTTNFSHSGSSVSNIKSLMFCDWTIAYAIERHGNREPDFWEKAAIKKQDKEVRKSNYIVTLFPDVYDYMKDYYKTNNIYYLGNVINSEILDIDVSKLYINKKKNNTILFIGRKAYISSAKALIKAVELLNKERTSDYYKVIIIGMTEVDFEEKSEYVEYLGYLSKGNEEQKKKYYDSVLNALAVVNTTEKWSGASSMIECMYYATPVITSPYDAFVETFGKEIEFGYYCDNKAEDIKVCIENLSSLSQDEYKEVCQKANEAVKDFTWDNYVDKIIKLCEID